MVHIDTRSTESGTRLPEWYKLGSQIAELANKISGRYDIVGLAGPTAGSGAPACFKPAIAEVELNTDVVFGRGTQPTSIGNFATRDTQYEFPKATGAVIHEAFHARFSRWNPEASASVLKRDEFDALMLLEEPRIEAQGVKEQPNTRVFLRSSALEIIVADFEADANKNSSDVQSMTNLVGLIHGRIIGGVLDADEVREVTDFVEDFLGAEVVEKLSSIIEKFIAHNAHYNIEPCHELAIEWAKIVRDLKEERGESSDSDSEAGSGSESDSESGSGSLSRVVSEVLERLTEASDEVSISNYDELNDQQESEEWAEAVKERSKGAKQQRENQSVAQEVFGKGTGPVEGVATGSRLVETRQPTANERRSAVKVARELERARYRERDIIEVRSNVPGGRLRTRAIVQNEAMRSIGLQPQTEAWRRNARKTTDEPTLSIGVMVDISGSMSEAMKPMATTAWVMSEAVKRVQGKTAMVYFGSDVFPTLKAGQHLDEVTVYTAPDATEKFDKAFRALDGSLNLLNGNGARLLVVVSDGHFTQKEIQHTQKWLGECNNNGVAVVWITFDGGYSAKTTVRGYPVELLIGSSKNPTDTVDAIGRACAKALSAVGSRNG